NPNCGKTALFNLLTGARQKVANYAGVTVERKVGVTRLKNGRTVSIIDLPGSYSLTPAPPDEQITLEVIEGRRHGEAAPDAIVAVVDATNLRMNLRLMLELQQLGRPLIVALNMADVARAEGLAIDVARLSAELGCPVVETVAVKADGHAILVLEDSGYLPRAAFLLDNLMGKVGLSGRAFIPLLSSFACAIPGIMATRTIANWKDRLSTIMIAPLMTCSARLPVYALLIGAF